MNAGNLTGSHRVLTPGWDSGCTALGLVFYGLGIVLEQTYFLSECKPMGCYKMGLCHIESMPNIR